MRARIPVLEIMTHKPVTIAAGATVVEAAKVMREKNIGSLVVVDRGIPTGIVTERDLVTKVAASDLQPSRVFVKGIEGHCEACGVYSTNLMWDRNLLACPECRGG